jgi:hypothetical protein
VRSSAGMTMTFSGGMSLKRLSILLDMALP